jgi:hypothetical protein
LRLLSGAVSRRTLEQLQQTLQQSPSEYPWQVVNQVILAESVDLQQLVQQGLAAQRDWILRGGREIPRPSPVRQAKGMVARLVAQLIFGALFAIVLVLVLVLLHHKLPWLDIYRLGAVLPGAAAR